MNGGTPKSSTLRVFSPINHPFWSAPVTMETPHIVTIYELVGGLNPSEKY